MTPLAALLAAGLWAGPPDPVAAPRPSTVFAAELPPAAEAPPWWAAFALPLPDPADLGPPVPLVLRAEPGEHAIRLLGTHDESGAGGDWVTETSLLSQVLKSKGQVRADYWTDFDDTTRVGVQAVATTWLRFAVDAEVNYWQQTRPPFAGDRLGGTFWTGDLNLVARVLDHPRGRLRTGIGTAYIIDDADDLNAGFNGTIALDAYLLSHAIAGFEFDYGKIGGDDLLRWRAEGGWSFSRAEIRAGYDDYKLGGEDRSGWFAGLMLRY